MPECRYLERVWLNEPDCEATGSVVAFDGTVERNGRVSSVSFLEIADCQGKVSLHSVTGEDGKRFIRKMRLLATIANNFADALESKQQD